MKSSLFGALVVFPALAVGCGHIDDPPPQNASYVSWANQGTTGAPAPAASAQTTSADIQQPPPGPMVVSSQPDARNADDRKLADQIRKTLSAEASLKNAELDRVRVMTASGKVTLNGMVPTSADSTTIEQKIRALGGVTAVDNQIEVLH